MSRIALLISVDLFESWFGGVFGLDREKYLQNYRNDFLWGYMNLMRSRGIEPTLYVPALHEGGKYETQDGYHVRFLRVSGWYRPWIKYPILGKTPIGRYAKEYANCVAFLSDLKQALARDGVDVLYVQEYWTARFDLLTHNVEVPIIGGDHGGRSRRQIKVMKRAAFKLACGITCQTHDEMREVVRYGGKPTYLPNGIDTDFFSPKGAQCILNSKSILTIARLTDHQKRTSDLIAALPYLGGEWSLTIAGTGPDEGMLRHLAVKLGVTDRVRFLGFVNDKATLHSLYLSHGVFALPSAWEGLPLVALEAMSCGVAVVVSDIRAFDHLIEDGCNGVKSPVGDPKALAEGILKAHRVRDRIGPEARQHIVENFSNDKFFEKLSKLIAGCSTSESTKEN